MSSPAADRADLAFAIKLAEDAGASTLAWFQSATLAVEHKGDGSPVTAADLAARAECAARRPPPSTAQATATARRGGSGCTRTRRRP